MSGEFIAFLILALIAIAGGVMMLNFDNVIYMLLSLVATFLSLAGIYVLLSAEFIAVVQVLIYSGAVAIIMLFGIMLTNPHDKSKPVVSKWRMGTVLVSIVGFFITVWFAIKDINFGDHESTLHINNTQQIGEALFSKYAIPFELTSVILLVALVGAIVLAKKDDGEEETKEAKKHE